MKRNFLRDFVRLGENTECPGMFMLWSGLCAVSCALGRKVYLNFSTGAIFPNLYVILVAGAGKCRKSTSIKFAEDMLRALNPQPNLISQRISAEGLIDALRMTQVNDEEHLLRSSCEGFVIADEFKTFLNKKTFDSGLGTLLIPFWDAKDEFEYRTKGRGIELVHNSCLGILGGSTIQGIKEAIPQEAVGDGMCSRFIFAYEDQSMPPVAFPEFTDEKHKLIGMLTADLQEVLSLEGEMTLTNEAREYYEKWYNKFREESKLFDNIYLQGYASRRHTHMLKLSMSFAASEFSLLIGADHLVRADTILRKSEADLSKVMGMISSTEEGAYTEIVFDLIKKGGTIGVSRHSVLRDVSHKVDSRKLTEILETLVHSRRVEQKTVGAEIRYRTKG